MAEVINSLVAANNHVDVIHEQLRARLAEHKVYNFVKADVDYEEHIYNLQEQINEDIYNNEETEDHILAHNAKFASQATGAVEKQLDFYETVQFGTNVADSLVGLVDMIPIIGPIISSILHVGSSIISNFVALHHAADALIKNFNIETVKSFVQAGKQMLTLQRDEASESDVIEKGKAALAGAASQAISTLTSIASDQGLVGQTLDVYVSSRETALVFPEDLSPFHDSSSVLVSMSPPHVEFSGSFNTLDPIDSRDEEMIRRLTLPLPRMILDRIQQVVAQFNLPASGDHADTISVLTNLIDTAFSSIHLGDGVKQFFHDLLGR